MFGAGGACEGCVPLYLQNICPTPTRGLHLNRFEKYPTPPMTRWSIVLSCAGGTSQSLVSQGARDPKWTQVTQVTHVNRCDGEVGSSVSRSCLGKGRPDRS